MDIESIYLKSPVFIQSLLVNLQGYRIKRTRFNSSFHKYLYNYLKSDHNKIDHKQLLDFLIEAKKTIFWKTRFEKFNVKINDSVNLKEEIQKLPILSKQEVKSNLDLICNTDIKEKVSLNHTSGTTGSGLVFPQTLTMENAQWAIWWRYRIWNGINLDSWMGWFGGRSIANINQKSPAFWRVNYPMKQVMFSAHHLNLQTVKYYFDEIKNRKLTWLHGYPSQISLLAHLFIESNLTLPIGQIKIITLGAESFLESQREIIEKVFNATIKQHYGLAEGVANISEHKEGAMIPDQDFCFTEFITVDKDPSYCKIVGTNYNNVAFPLIRYDTGDIAKIEWQTDGSPKVLSIDGRQEDFITLKNGVKLGRLDHIFKDITEIVEAQILQKDDYSLIIKIVKGTSFNEKNSINQLLTEVKKRIGQELKIDIEYVERIERTKSGKLRFVISDIQ